MSAPVPPENLDEARASKRRDAALAVVADLLARWDRGEATDDGAVIAAHSDLEPELADEIRNARLVRRAIVTARKAGGDDGRDAPTEMRILSDEEIEAPLDFSTGDAVAPVEPPLRIPGCVGLTPIAVGGQAAVYRAVQESTGRAVAVKVVAGGALAGSRRRVRFEREAAILASFRHPHVVDILDRGRTPGGDFYLLMEFVDGCDLDEWWRAHVPRAGADNTRRLLELLAKACRAVGEAHARGIVHRDLKPSNVRVDARGEPRVLDFGLARDAGDAADRTVTTDGHMVGSVPWSSPEHAGGADARDAIDARSDVYSLGVVLYQAVAGELPYAVDGPLHKVLERIAHAVPAPPSRMPGARTPLDRRAAAALDAVVLKALAKRPADRYANATELADDLDRVLAGKPVSVRVRSRRRRLVVGAVLATWSLSAFGGVVWHLTRPPEPPVVFELPSITNSAGMRLVRVPAGECSLGSAADEPGRTSAELDRRRVSVGEFYVGTTEVTQRQWEQVMGRRPPPPSWRGADMPVHGVSWDEAVAFCRRLSELEGRPYRLPTEDEWEYACRAGTTTPYFGGGPDRAEYVAWSRENTGGRGQPVGGKWANAWGLFDTHGNAAEWCAGEFRTYPDATSGPATRSVRHVARGGSAAEKSAQCRAAARRLLYPFMQAPDTGFRVALDVTP